MKKLKNKERGLLVCGPELRQEVAESIASFAKAWNIPIFADPLSQLRTGIHDKDNVIETYDSILRSKQIRTSFKPDFIIRFGAMPVSKMYLHYAEEHRNVPQFIVEEHEGYRDPVNTTTQFIFADSIQFCEEMIKHKRERSSSVWLEKWQMMNQISKNELLESTSSLLTEGIAVKTVLDAIPNESTLFVGNSMAIRDVDTFLLANEKRVSLYANRGASGIDGVTSSALGVASTKNIPVTLIIGDLSFYHDLNGLLTAKQYNIDLTVLLINNNGGGIFSFLPQKQHEDYFEKLFGTPLNIGFKPVVEMYGGTYTLAGSEEELYTSLLESYANKGLSVIEVQTDRTENMKWHRELWGKIEKQLLTFIECDD